MKYILHYKWIALLEVVYEGDEVRRSSRVYI